MITSITNKNVANPANVLTLLNLISISSGKATDSAENAIKNDIISLCVKKYLYLTILPFSMKCSSFFLFTDKNWMAIKEMHHAQAKEIIKKYRFNPSGI